jgi:uncharacterized protein YbaP (TraB family)
MKTIKQIWCYCLATVFAATALPTQVQAQGTAAENNDKLEKTLLWQITGKGLKKPSYLFGTIHMVGEKDYFLHKATQKAMGKTKRLVTEIDMSNQLGMAMEMFKLAPMTDGKTLKDVVSIDDYAKIKNYFEKESTNPEVKMMPFSMIENWKPMLLQSFLYTDMIKGKTKSYELELITLAKKDKKTFGGLETIGDQMSVFDKIPYADQAKGLVEAIDEIKKGKTDATAKNEFDHLVALYTSQDVDGMVEKTAESFDKMDNSEEVMLTARNKNWIPLIGEMASKEPCFFAVGAAHLGGKNGVIRLLRQAGYTVTPVENK